MKPSDIDLSSISKQKKLCIALAAVEGYMYDRLRNPVTEAECTERAVLEDYARYLTPLAHQPEEEPEPVPEKPTEPELLTDKPAPTPPVSGAAHSEKRGK